MKAISKFRYFSLSKKQRIRFKLCWQFKSYNLLWVKGYSQDFPIRKRYYYTV